MTGHGGHSHSGRGLIGGALHHLTMIVVVLGIFLVGAAVDFAKEPWFWVEKFWFPVLVILLGVAMGVRSRWR